MKDASPTGVEAHFEFASPEAVQAMTDVRTGLRNTLQSLLSVEITVGENSATITGPDALIARDLLRRIEVDTRGDFLLPPAEIMRLLESYKPVAVPPDIRTVVSQIPQDIQVRTKKKTVTPASEGQKPYMHDLLTRDMTFGLGPAGTGKTFLAIGAACHLLERGNFEKIILARPAVEAGEKLGFLPGDAKEKVDPFMQPLYDALREFLPPKQVEKMMEDKTIEISPLAYMRGRTLKNAYIILDEAQNATVMQMKMFLTRLGEGSRMAIVGDPTQNDLPRGAESGLNNAVDTLSGISAIGIHKLSAADVIRHPLVAQIIKAYEAA